jgi:hypothetical protein
VVFLHRAPFDYTFTGSAPLNRWTHVAGTYDAASGQAALYINGQPVRSPPPQANACHRTHVY